MNKCYYCLSPKQETFFWSHLCMSHRLDLLCDACLKEIEWIGPIRCLKCGREMDAEGFCADCTKWKKSTEWGHLLEYNVSFLKYNAFMKEFFAKYKYRGDYELAFVLAELIKERMNSLEKVDIICPIPLSNERLVERGFNQVEAVLDFLNLSYEPLLTRQFSEKQAKKGKKERMELGDIFFIEKQINQQTVLIVDDIYTTGSTIYHAAKVLNEAGASKVFSMTFVRA